MQFPIFMIALSTSAYGYIPLGSGAHAAQCSVILRPIFLTVLFMFVSGLALQEPPGAKKRYKSGQGCQQYQCWTERTSMLVLFHPPTFLKRTLFLEFSIYVFDPAKYADQKM
jgi:hypothetical protein